MAPGRETAGPARAVIGTKGLEHEHKGLARSARVVRGRYGGERTPAAAQQQDKPNILFIMGDDIGWMQPSIYHRGLMVGETPNIDRIGKEGAHVRGLRRHAELHLGTQRLLHRHVSAAHRHDPAATAGQPVLPAARHAGARQVPASTSATTPASSARTTWATTPRRCRRRTASRSTGATSITSTPCSR